jgi:Tol biopolymer transport system component
VKSLLPIAPLVAMLASLAALASPALATSPGRNGLIVFAADTGNGSQLYTVSANGRGLRQITNVAGEALHPDWSPDGRRIAYEFDTDVLGSIVVIDPDGGNAVTLTASCCDGQPAFTPDGAHLVFEHYDPATNDDAIWSMDIDGSHRLRLVTGPAGASDPNLSPDGTRLSYVAFNGQTPGAALFTSQASGANPFAITPFEADVAIKQDWSPDGRRIVFTESGYDPIAGVSANIDTVRPDGAGLRHLTHFAGGDVNAFAGSYSPDGRWIVFRLEDHGSYALYRMHPDGSAMKMILPASSFRPRYIDWGPGKAHTRK